MKKKGACNEARIIRVCRSGIKAEVERLANDCGVQKRGIANLPFFSNLKVVENTCPRLYAHILKQDADAMLRNADPRMVAFLDSTVGVHDVTPLVRFDGDALSALFAIGYLLRDPAIAQQVCMILRPLQNVLKTPGRVGVGFPHFALVWVYDPRTQTIGLSVPGDNRKQYIAQINKCLQRRNFFFSLLALVNAERENGTAHATTIFYDKTTGILERFDPYESTNDASFASRILDRELQTLFSGLVNFKAVVSPPHLPVFERKGLQWMQEVREKEHAMGDPGGFCIPWSVIYAQARLHSPLQDPESIPALIMHWAKTQQTSLTKFVRSYARQMEDIGFQIFANLQNSPKQLDFEEAFVSAALAVIAAFGRDAEIF